MTASKHADYIYYMSIYKGDNVIVIRKQAKEIHRLNDKTGTNKSHMLTLVKNSSMLLTIKEFKLE